MIVPDDLIAELVASGAGSWETVEREMTLPRYYALARYWARHPPTHRLMAAWLGFGGDARAKSEPADLGELVAMFGTGAIR